MRSVPADRLLMLGLLGPARLRRALLCLLNRVAAPSRRGGVLVRVVRRRLHPVWVGRVLVASWHLPILAVVRVVRVRHPWREARVLLGSRRRLLRLLRLLLLLTLRTGRLTLTLLAGILGRVRRPVLERRSLRCLRV